MPRKWKKDIKRLERKPAQIINEAFLNTHDLPGNPASTKKPLMAREPDCIFCLACENVCPPLAIKIFTKAA